MVEMKVVYMGALPDDEKALVLEHSFRLAATDKIAGGSIRVEIDAGSDPGWRVGQSYRVTVE